jgi:hypothetical protein
MAAKAQLNNNDFLRVIIELLMSGIEDLQCIVYIAIWRNPEWRLNGENWPIAGGPLAR